MTKYNGWIILIFIFIIAIIISMYTIKYKVNEVIDRVNLFDNYTEECNEYKTVEKYELVDNSDRECDINCEHRETCIELYPESGCKNDADCFAYCKTKDKPYVKFYNETICTKYILVKKVD